MNDTADKHILYTDGACSGNPGRGGWGVVYIPPGLQLEDPNIVKLAGEDPKSTNNRMELTACIKGLELIPSGENVIIFTDSEYTMKSMTVWIDGWIKRGWKTASKSPVKNVDLIKELYALVQDRNVHWEWVKGHSGDPGNDLADALASTAAGTAEAGNEVLADSNDSPSQNSSIPHVVSSAPSESDSGQTPTRNRSNSKQETAPSRLIVLDTETTGLNCKEGDKIIEIGCIEIVDRQITGANFHQYIHPQRDIPVEAQKVHGITLESLEGKPLFGDIIQEFLDFIGDAALVIHNAPFDLGFLNEEIQQVRADFPPLEKTLQIIDTLNMARRMRPGQRNSLDALIEAFQIRGEERELHGALKDARLLSQVYLYMTGGQKGMDFNALAAQGSVATTHADSGVNRNNGQIKDSATDLVPNSESRRSDLKYGSISDSDAANHATFIEEMRTVNPDLVWDTGPSTNSK